MMLRLKSGKINLLLFLPITTTTLVTPLSISVATTLKESLKWKSRIYFFLIVTKFTITFFILFPKVGSYVPLNSWFLQPTFLNFFQELSLKFIRSIFCTQQIFWFLVVNFVTFRNQFPSINFCRIFLPLYFLPLHFLSPFFELSSPKETEAKNKLSKKLEREYWVKWNQKPVCKFIEERRE